MAPPAAAPADLGRLPQPPSSKTLRLPTGGSLTGMVDLPKGMSEDCHVAFNLMLQLGPFLASIACLVNVLQFCMWLIEFVKAVPDPIKIAKEVEKLPPIADKLASCFGFVIPLIGMCQFIKDVLSLIRDFLRCLVELLESIVHQQLQLQIQFDDAQGNPDLLEVLQKAQDNLDSTFGQAVQSCAPIFGLLQAMTGFMEVAGVGAFAIPSMDDLAGGAPDVVLIPLQDLVDVLDAVIEALPC